MSLPPHIGGRHVLTERERKTRRARNIALGLVIGLLVVIFYTVTIVKLGPGVLSQPM